MRIVITGVPGTGKTKTAKLLAKLLNLKFIEIKKIVQQKKLLEEKEEVDIRGLRKALRALNTNDCIIEGHLACEIKIPCDFIFVLRCKPEILEKRLKKRKYKRQKIIENLMAEVLDYCTQRIMQIYKKQPIEIRTDKRNLKKVITEIVVTMRTKRKKVDNVRYDLQKYLKRYS